MVRKIIQPTNARRKLHAKNAKVRTTTQSSALRILHQTQNAHSVEKQGIQLRIAEPTTKLRRRLKSQESKSTRSNVSNPSTIATGQTQGHPASALSSTRPQMQEQVPSQLVPLLTIGQRLQQLAMSADRVTASPTSRGILPLAYPGREGMDQN